MQTVINNYTINVTGSTIIRGNTSGHVAVQNYAANQFSEWTTEMARNFEKLSVRAQVDVINYIFALLDGQSVLSAGG